MIIATANKLMIGVYSVLAWRKGRLRAYIFATFKVSVKHILPVLRKIIGSYFFLFVR